jgi:hypothetical protein
VDRTEQIEGRVRIADDPERGAGTLGLRDRAGCGDRGRRDLDRLGEGLDRLEGDSTGEAEPEDGPEGREGEGLEAMGQGHGINP